MAANEIHVGDIGTVLRTTLLEVPAGSTTAVPVNLSTATSIRLVFVNPKKRRFVVNALLTTDGSNGQVEYTTQEGDLDVSGRWRMQAVVEMSGRSWSSDIITFQVMANL